VLVILELRKGSINKEANQAGGAVNTLTAHYVRQLTNGLFDATEKKESFSGYHYCVNLHAFLRGTLAAFSQIHIKDELGWTDSFATCHNELPPDVDCNFCGKHCKE